MEITDFDEKFLWSGGGKRLIALTVREKATLQGNGQAHHLHCGNGLMVQAYIKTDQIVHFKFVHSRILELDLNKAEKEIMGREK